MTMDREFEIEQLGVFREMVRKGLVSSCAHQGEALHAVQSSQVRRMTPMVRACRHRARSATGSAPIRSPSDDVSISTDMNGDEENWPWPDADTDAVPVK